MAAVISQQRERQPLRRSARLTVTDEFWIFPLEGGATPTTPTTPTTDGGEDHDDDDRGQPRAPTYLPGAHHQLLLSDAEIDHEVAYEDLKGHDHRARAAAAQRRPRRRGSPPPVAALPRRSWLLSFALPAKSNRDLLLCRADDEDDVSLPGMTSGSDDSSSTGSETGDDLSLSSASASNPKGVSFAPSVRVQPIPHSSILSPSQRRRMYSSSMEVRQNKSRNKREYRYDGCDWRNATEEWEMGVDMVSGELVHPAHEHGILGC